MKAATGKAFPQDPIKQLRGAVEAVFSSWNGARAIAYRGPRADQPRPRHGGQRAGDGVRQPRRQLRHRRRLHPQRRHRREQALRRLPRQRPGRGRGRRHPQHRGSRRPGPPLPGDPRPSCWTIFARLERHYRDMCDTEFTIEQGKLWMLQTRVGKRTGAAALKMAVDMTTGTGRGPNRWKISRNEALHARHRRPPRPGAAPAVRRLRAADRQGSGRLSRRRGRRGLLRRRRSRGGRGRRARRSSSCATRRAPRTSTA